MREGSFANPHDERTLPTLPSLRLAGLYLAPTPSESRTIDDMAWSSAVGLRMAVRWIPEPGPG